MALIQEPEVQLAQRLASNEKPIRTKAMKKLRKYINVRSQKAAGGFTGDELLKLWKGLFYCLWMQDKPLLQEELSKRISTLIHSFQDVDGQFLYLESFLQTFKREWTGIDRLRMDKFFQLIRFMFRQMFEMLKKKNWESSVVSRFLELLTAQLLQSSSGAPSGLQFHILDLYMTELAAVGSAELTADQSLIFIEPFCKTAAKTKDRTLFGAICNNIFSTVIDQAPFAIEDLMKEVKAAEASDSDSGQASEEDDEEDELKEKTTSKSVSKKGTGKQINGKKSHDDEEEEEEDDELLHLEGSDTEVPCDNDIGPVLQFDYAALAGKLFQLASRSSTPSHNRKRLYKIINVLRDLSEGNFPQDEYPEEVSTDEDDDMFCSRKRMKRGGHPILEHEEGVPASKKSKGKKKEASTLNKQNTDSGKDDHGVADLTANNENKKKKKRKKKKKKTGQVGEKDADRSGQEQTVTQGESRVKESDGGLECSQAEATEGQAETLLLSEVKKQPSVTVTEETCQPTPCTNDKGPSEELAKERGETSEAIEAVGEQQTPDGTEPQVSSESSATAPGKKKGKKKKGLNAPIQTERIVSESKDSAEVEMTPVSSEKEDLRAEKNLEEVEVESPSNGLSTEADFPSLHCVDSAEDGPTTRLEKQTDSTTLVKSKGKKKSRMADEAQTLEGDVQLEVDGTNTEITRTQEASQDATVVPLIRKAKKKDMQRDTTLDDGTIPSLRKRRKTNQKESKTEMEEEGAAETPQVADAEKLLFEITMTAPAKKKKTQKLPSAQVDAVEPQSQLQVVGSVDAELPLDETEVFSSSGTPAKKKKKKKIPVVFEFEADEQEAAAQEAASTSTSLGRVVGQPSTPLSAKKSQKKSDFITFQSKAPIPTPLFCKTKGGLSTPLSRKKSQTPTSESKKVTFGLKNNRTAEFRKTDRSLLVSPDGSSRVPFDPKQKPKFGVLKSPATPLSTRTKKTPKSTSSLNTPKSASKGRPSAADFF